MIRLPLLLSLILLSFNSNAGFNWKLDSLSASGDIVFFDDFTDNLLNVPPTSELSIFLGTISEAGGHLVFSDSDGAGLSAIPFPETLRDTVFLNSTIPDNGVGTTWTGSFVPDIEILAALPLGSGYGISINNAGAAAFAQATLSVISDGLGNVFITLADPITAPDMVVDFDIITTTSGNIVLSLAADPLNDMVTGSYSLDGGGNFIPLSGSVSIAGDLHSWAFGQLTTDPVPEANVPLPFWLYPILALVLLKLSYIRGITDRSHSEAKHK